jgi:hypothetical protein
MEISGFFYLISLMQGMMVIPDYCIGLTYYKRKKIKKTAHPNELNIFLLFT